MSGRVVLYVRFSQQAIRKQFVKINKSTKKRGGDVKAKC